MFVLDIRTIVVATLLIDILTALIIFSVWRQNHSKFSGLSFWVTYYIFQAVAVPLTLMRGIIPDFVSIVLSNLFIFVGGILFLFGFGKFFNLKVNKILNYILVIIFAVSYFYYSIIEPLLISRIYIMSFGLILISLQIVWLAFSNIKENKNREMIGSVFVLYIFVSTMRVIATVLGERGNDYFVNDATDGFFLIFYQMMTVLLTYSIVLTINKRLFAEIEVQSEEREKMLIKLNHLATIDGLTNVFNRMKIEDVLNAEIARFKRYGHAFSIMLIDIDHFKIVNDTYGHPQGDHVLTEMAELLRCNLRKTDYIGRWGGDEFLIITPGSSIGETKTLAQKLLTASSNYEYIQEMTVTMSIGISTIREGISEKELIIDADKALYMAKANGRNMIEVGI